jgi:hypothetical protein
MLNRLRTSLLFIALLPNGCLDPSPHLTLHLNHRAMGNTPETIALYEARFGHPKHISVGYSSQDLVVLRDQIRKAKSRSIFTFVVDWYGDREPFIAGSYASMEKTAANEKFQVAMMYDETDEEEGATDEAIADFTMFHDTYLSSKAVGHQAYLTYEGRPVIVIFPKGGHTDWKKVRAVVDQWNPSPLLIQENLPKSDADTFGGCYAWVSPGEKGWVADGSNSGEQYLSEFYETMGSRFSDKIVVGARGPISMTRKRTGDLTGISRRDAGRHLLTHLAFGTGTFRRTMRRPSS